MKCLAWNCRGLGNPCAVRSLWHLLKKEAPHVVFLSETKLHEKRLERIRRKYGMQCCFGVSSEGSSGGLAMFWKESVTLQLQSFSKNHIDMEFGGVNGEQEWRLTRFYGEPDARRRPESWNLLRLLASTTNTPWLCFGDFNELMWSHEKSGHKVRNENQMEAFRLVLDENGLEDFVFSGQWYTWEMGILEGNNVRERLDRGVANQAWWELFPQYKVAHLTASVSDHCPIMIDTEGNAPKRSGARRKCRYKFEALWAKEADCENFVRQSWCDISKPAILDKMKGTGNSLLEWQKQKFQGLRRSMRPSNK